MRGQYLLAEGLGVFGGSLAFTALALLLGLGGNPWTLALLAALPFLTLPLDLLAGLLLDRLDRTRLLLLGVYLRGGLLLLLALLPKEPLFLLSLAFLFQAVLALDLPAWHALLVRLARGRLEREGGRLQAAQLLGDSLGDLLAPPLLLLAKPLPFALGGAMLLLEGRLLRDLPPYPPPQEARGEPLGAGALLAGVAFLLWERRLLSLTLYALALNFLGGLALALLPLLALERGVPPALFGLYPLGLSLGGFLGSLLAARVGPGMAVWGGHGARMLGLALLLLPFPFGPLGTLLAGLGGAVSGVHLRAYRQRLAPEALLGRVQAGGVALLSLESLLGTLLAGTLGEDPQRPVGATLLLALFLLPLGLWALGRAAREVGRG
ncbi:MFS transporter [Thermus scotoductus]|uniref:MFS transporter n=1 Tax=Thermus scotoductus TaxID=37636 RepID=UPI00056E479D|nr:MFS transporter [Thermus scotoductus]